VREIHLVQAPNGRGATPQELYEVATKVGIEPERLHMSDTLLNTFNDARTKATQDGDILVVCGTFFIMGPIRKALGIQDLSDPLDLNEK
jgi:dihydrofolate synthase/folylpolyglutamate synthase